MAESWKRNFFTIWGGQAVSTLTSSVLQFGFTWYLTAKTSSPLVLSMAMLIGFLPRMLLGPLAGVLIDKYDRKKIMIFSDLFIAAVSLVTVFFMDQNKDVSTGIIYLVLFLRAIGSALHNPCIQAITPSIVPMSELGRCAGYSESLESISQILSPAIAGVLFSVWTLDKMIYMDVIGAVIAVGVLLVADIPTRPASERHQSPNFYLEAKEGWDILKSQKGILGLVFTTTLYSVAMMPVSALFPLMSMDYFSGGSNAAAAVEIIFAVGLLVGSIVISITGGTKNKMHSILISFVIMGVSLLISGLLLPTQLMAFKVCAFFMGVSGPLLWTMYRALLQQSFADEYLGRVISISNSIRVMASPVGMIISGLFTEAVGAKQWFTIAGVLVFIGMIICIADADIRNCDINTKAFEQ